jgi:hypothetical protein
MPLITSLLLSSVFFFSLAQSADAEFTLEHQTRLNTDWAFTIPKSHIHEPGWALGGYFPSLWFAHTGERAYRPPFSKLAVHNPGGERVFIDAIEFNSRGIHFTTQGMAAKYQTGELNLDSAKKLFWDVYALISHATLPDQRGDREPFQLLYANGVGLCGFTNNVMASYFAWRGHEVRSSGVSGHSLAEITVDGKRRIFDFDQKAYYLTLNGDVAGAEELSDDPLLVTAQKTYGLSNLDDPRWPTQAAIILQKLDPERQNHIDRPEYKDEVLTLEAGDDIVFTSEQMVHGPEKKMDLLWEKSTNFLWKGYINTPWMPLPDRAATVSRQSPFLFDNVTITIKPHGPPSKTDRPRVIYGKIMAGEELYRTHTINLASNESELRVTLNKATPEIHVELMDPFRTSASEAVEFKISFGFFYNGRAFLDMPENSRIKVHGSPGAEHGSPGAEIDVRLELDEAYRNDFYEVDEKPVFLYDDEIQAFTITPPPTADGTRKAPSLWEYFLAEDKENLPVSPSFYWTDNTGSQRIPPDFLQNRDYRIFYRGYYGNGNWSGWKTTDAVACPKDDLMTSAQAGHIVFSKYKIFPVRETDVFVRPSQVPQGGEYAAAPGEEEWSRVDYRFLNWPENDLPTDVNVPPWANYYRLTTEKGVPLGPLRSVRGRENKGLLVLRAVVVDWPFEVYRYESPDNDDSALFQEWLATHKPPAPPQEEPAPKKDSWWRALYKAVF